MVKNLPAMQEMQVPSLGWEDLLEKGIATHSSILAWRSPWTEEPGELHEGHKKSDVTEQLTLYARHCYKYFIYIYVFSYSVGTICSPF